MTKMCPNSQTKVSEGDRLIVLNKEGFSCSRAGGHQIFYGQDMRVGDIGHVSDIPHIAAVPDDEWGFPLSDASVDDRNQLIVARSTEHGGSEGTGRHLAVGCLEDECFRSGLADRKLSASFLRSLLTCVVTTFDSPYMREVGNVGHCSLMLA